MEKIKYNIDDMKFISLFEAFTGAKVKDCIDSTLLYFIVEPGQFRRAVGKNAINVKRLEKALNRKIKIVEFNPELVAFIKNLIFPVKIRNISLENEVILVECEDLTGRGLVIGRNATNLRNTEKIAQRYFNFKEIKVK